MLAWIDLETTGLDPRKERLLEAACIVTRDDLTVVGTFSEMTSEACRVDWSNVPKVVLDMHLENGLLVESLKAGHQECFCERHNYILMPSRSHDCLDYILYHWLKNVLQTNQVTEPVQLAGSSVTLDREFMRYYLPMTLGLLHYRSLDVSSISEAARRLWPYAHEKRPRAEHKAHRALPDVIASIELARHYAKALGSVGEAA